MTAIFYICMECWGLGEIKEAGLEQLIKERKNGAYE